MPSPSVPPLQVDRRAGSGELAPPLTRMGARVRVTTLACADVAWDGRGPDDRVVRVGVERKKVAELLGAWHDSRFVGKQLPALLRTYDYPWLLVEGATSCGKAGELLVYGTRPRGSHSYVEYEAFLLTLQQKAGLRVIRTTGFTDTCHWIYGAWRWWQKGWDRHTSAYAVANTHVPDAALLQTPTLVRKVAAQLPGIGWTRSAAVAQHFPSVRAMAVARPQEWTRIDGIGAGTAAKVVKAVRGEQE